MRRLLPLAIVPLLLILPATAMAKPKVCRKATIRAALQAQNEDVSAGFGDIRCGDVTHDGHKDAVFTTLSGGTAGATHFGVLTGASATSGDSALVYYDSGYKLGIDRVNSRRFDVQQPFYKETDANCCPSAFDVTPYRWDGEKFKPGKSTRHKHAQKRFFAS